MTALYAIKPAVLLFFVFAIIALFAGVYLPLGIGLASMVVYFVLLVGGTVALCRYAYARRRDLLGVHETPAELLEEMLSNLLGVLGTGPFAVLLACSAITSKKPVDNWMIGFIAVCAILFLSSLRSTYRAIATGD